MLDGPFRLGRVPQWFEGKESHDQDVIHDAMESTAADTQAPHVQLFHASEVKAVKLSTLQKIYKTHDTNTAMKVLSRRRFLRVDSEFQLTPHDKDILSQLQGHYLDYVLFVGNRIGLDAALPNTMRVDDSIIFRLNLGHADRLWPSANIKDLPFDPQGRLMFVGASGDSGEEQLWIAMIPKYLINRGAGPVIATLDAPTTAMCMRHRLILTLFFAYALDSIDHPTIHSDNTHPVPIDVESVKRVTNIL